MSSNRNTDTSSNFGGKGWLMIIMAGIFFYFYSGTCTDGLNTIVTNFANAHGLDEAAVLAVTTPANWIGLTGSLFWAWFIEKKSIRTGALVTGVLGGISYMLYGVVSSVTGFGIITTLVNFMGWGFCWTVADALIANWFPTKKGLALGWATMGQNLASATFVLLLTAFMGVAGLNGSFYLMGGLFIACSILVFAVIRDTPEDYGCTPDNMSPEQLEALRKERASEKPLKPFSIGEMLKMKEIWKIGIGYGILVMVTVSLISRLIPRLIMSGWAPPTAIASMTVCAIIGLFGSYLTGWLDQKLSTRVASVLYALWYLVALILCAIPTNNTIILFLTIFFTGIGIGGIGNLFPSMTATIFHKTDFVRAMAILNLLTAIVRAFAFVILAFSLERTGAYHLSYGIIAVLDVIAILIIWSINDKPKRNYEE
jgi:OFA family oxalate/formate antiporter-like MFS transporter